jgi:hypothetical protein
LRCKTIFFFLAVVLLLPLIPAAGAEDEPVKEVGPYIGVLIQDKMYIPLRGVLEQLGYQVNWDGVVKTAIVKDGSKQITLAVSNENNVTRDAPAILKDGQVYIPLRFAGESMDNQVSWDSTSRTATVRRGNTIAYVFAKNREPIRHYSCTLNVSGRKIPVNVVEIPLHSAIPDMVVARDAVGNTEELASMAKRSGAVVAINGTFFNAYGGEPNPYGNIMRNGMVVNRGSVGTTIGFRADGSTKFGHIEFNTITYNLNDYDGWEDIVTGLGAGPRLLTDGIITVNPGGEGFSSPKILEIRAARSAIGVKQDGTVVLVTTVANMDELASVMKQLNAYNAMNLDGGASSGLWFKGSYIRKPGRLLSNALIFK